MCNRLHARRICRYLKNANAEGFDTRASRAGCGARSSCEMLAVILIMLLT